MTEGRSLMTEEIHQRRANINSVQFPLSADECDLEATSDVVIAVMGATGTGKTTFVNLASGSNLEIGQGLESCTSAVQIAPPFKLFGRSIVLVDTPGFDDSSRSESDILKMIALYLESSYTSGEKLHGIIYLHRISDFRVGGVSRRNFSLFRKLCGESSLKNVVLVTNMWGEVSKEVGEARQRELQSDPMFFKPALDKEAKLLRHDNTISSAQSIIRSIIQNHPQHLQIQHELVEEHKDLSQTAAACEINRDLMEQAERHRHELNQLREDMEMALHSKNEETRRHIEMETYRVAAELRKSEEEQKVMAANYAEERSRMERHVQSVAEIARLQDEREKAYNQFQLQELRDRFDFISHTSQVERQRLENQMRSLENQITNMNRPSPRGLFGRLGRVLDSAFGM